MSARQLQKPWESYKRQSIQEAVIRLICREGLKSVTMERVAQEVGIAKGTVYLHYRHKQELLDSVKDSALAPLTTKVEEIFHGQGSAERKLRDYALWYLSYFDEHGDLFRILLSEGQVTRVHLMQKTARVIRDGIRGGVFRMVEPHNVAAMFVEACFGIVNQRLLTEKPGPVKDDARLIGDVFIHGLEKRRRA
jgi:AcrR family transcriptional regulator